MKISRDNLIGGLVIIAIGVLLLSQANSSNFITTAEGIDPMGYPRVLIYFFLFFGVLIILSPAGNAFQSGLPFFSRRTAAVVATLVVYALLVGRIGFGVTSFLSACAIGWFMGWRNPKSLLLSNLLGVACIWCMFNFVLSIPLPKGILF